jgi:hypothetical protein
MHPLYRFLIIVIGGYFITGCNKDPETKESDLYIGQPYQGGIIFYLDSSGEHGLIAASVDQATAVKWCGDDGNDSVRTEASFSAIGKGQFNTTAIVNKIGAGSYAASICNSLILENYDDWFLPSFDELALMYERKEKIGNLNEGWYWTSTDLLGQPRAYYARNLEFKTGERGMNSNMFKNTANKVRAIRAF